MADRIAHGRAFRMLTLINEHNRKCLAIDVARKLHSEDVLERLNQEIKQRTRVATLFPKEASLLRLVSAVLTETSAEWETGKIYSRDEE